MRSSRIFIGGLLGALTALIVVALNYLAFRWADLPRTSFSLFDWIARVMPGSIITLMIDGMVTVITRLNLGPTSTVAKQIEQALAVILFLLVGFLFGIVLSLIARNRPANLVLFGLLGGLIVAIPLIFIVRSLGFPPAGPVISTSWILLVNIVWGWVLAKLIQYILLPEASVPERKERRQFLTLFGLGSVSILVTAAGISLLVDDEQVPVTGDDDVPQTTDADASTTSGPAQSPPQSELNARIEPAPGTRPELTSNEAFYRIDINTLPPRVDGENWRLVVEGLVDQPLELTIEDIRARQAVSQAITLECISNRLGGDLIGTSIWTGVRLMDILEEAGLQEGAQEVYIESADGFFESVPMTDVMDERTLLVYEMNGEPLPVEHGYPLRIYIPNRFGMKQPKWITRMEVIDHEGGGYWVERGWSEEAIPPTTAVIDTVAVNADDNQPSTLPVGGIAFAGARGISKVEVQVDDSQWEEAELISPPLSPLTWVLWRYDWPVQTGQHTFRVRAYDGFGDLQPVERTDPHPAGATGIHDVTETIPAAE